MERHILVSVAKTPKNVKLKEKINIIINLSLRIYDTNHKSTLKLEKDEGENNFTYRKISNETSLKEKNATIIIVTFPNIVK